MPESVRVPCPKCGTPMNHHADKVDYTAEDGAAFDPAFDGAVKEIHQCPNPACGWIEMRRARPR